MTLALKHAILERDVAHLIFPDEVQVAARARRAEPAAPVGRIADARRSRPRPTRSTEARRR